MVIDAPHDVEAILALVGERRLKAIVCTHAHDDHVRVAPELRERAGAPILLHPDDRPLWSSPTRTCSGTSTCADGQVLEVGGAALTVAAHARARAGAVCLYVRGPRLRLHRRHPVPGRARCHRTVVQRPDVIVASIESRLLTLPDETVVHTGHGDDTTIGAERS